MPLGRGKANRKTSLLKSHLRRFRERKEPASVGQDAAPNKMNKKKRRSRSRVKIQSSRVNKIRKKENTNHLKHNLKILKNATEVDEKSRSVIKKVIEEIAKESNGRRKEKQEEQEE
eukprot:jgi/Bigna1/83319/fgenesh1_pg.106_\